METLAKIVALYLKVIGGILMVSATLVFCMGIWAIFQPSSHERLRAETHREMSPVFYMEH